MKDDSLLWTQKKSLAITLIGQMYADSSYELCDERWS